MIYEELIETLMKHYTSNEFEAEVKEARDEFFKWAGIFDEAAPEFEFKMAQFMDWYVFTRKLNSKGLPPVQVAMSDDNYVIPEDKLSLYKNLAANRHSIFEFLKTKNDDVHIKDLFSGYKLILKHSAVSVGFTRDEYFETRLIPHEDHFVFSNSFCFHPPAASRFILSEIKKIHKLKEGVDEAREALILRLFRMRYKFDQYKHVGLKEIYSNESKLRL